VFLKRVWKHWKTGKTGSTGTLSHFFQPQKKSDGRFADARFSRHWPSIPPIGPECDMHAARFCIHL
jgi:hypothetical protein